MADTRPIDVWLKFSDDEGDELAEYEGNTFHDGNGYRADWYHNDVGLVMSKHFDTYDDAANWFELEGFQDFTDNTDGNYATP